MATPTVLVTNGDAAKSVPLTRALARRGLRVVVAVPEDRRGIADRSRYCEELVTHPPLSNEEAAIDSLSARLRRRAIDVVLPIDDDMVAFAVRHRDRLERLARMAMPPSLSAEAALDKGVTARRARSVEGGLAVPTTYEVESPEEAEELPVERFPVLVKPRSAWGGQGIVWASSRSELAQAYRAVHADFPAPIVQQYVPYREGEKYQLLYLFDADGRLCSWFMHRILHEESVIRRAASGATMTGGSSLLWSSFRDVEVLERGRRLLEALGWRGFAFVECVRDREDGEMKLLEINPRFSGTIALPLRCGVDFAYGAYLVALGITPPRVFDYPVGRRAEHTFLRLADCVLKRRRVRELAGFLDVRTRDSVFTASDPLPSVLLAGRYLRNGLRRLRTPDAR